MAKGIAFFDFDGTITTTDSFFRFLLFCFGWKAVLGKATSIIPILFSYFFKFCDNETAKQSITSTFFRGMSEERFDSLCKQFAEQEIDKILRPKAIERIKWHKEQGHELYLVSASFTKYLKHFAEKYDMTVIATEIEVVDGKLTGWFATRNCWGPEKIERINEAVPDLDTYDDTYGYGDSIGDEIGMLTIVNHPEYKVF